MKAEILARGSRGAELSASDEAAFLGSNSMSKSNIPSKPMSLKKSEIDTMIEVMDKNIKDSTAELQHLLVSIANTAQDALELLNTTGTVRSATVIDPLLTTRANSLSLRIATATDVRASLKRARTDAI